MTSGCRQADDRQTAVQVADSDNAQEDGVYGKMEYSVTGVEVHDSSTGFAADLQEDSFSSQGLAPGGECDGVSIFELNDMSPIEVKIDGVGAGSNSVDQTFELE